MKAIKHDKQAIAAVKKYFKKRYSTIDFLSSFGMFDIVMYNYMEEELIFVQVRRYHCLPDNKPLKPIKSKKRTRMEADFVKWLMNHSEYVDVPIRFDIADVFVCDDDRAMVRHCINAGEAL